MNEKEITAMRATTKLAAFEITTREDVMCATEVEIRARLAVRTDDLIVAVDEMSIKSLIENAVGECITMKPRGKVKEAAK
jgi:hypothetical protein